MATHLDYDPQTGVFLWKQSVGYRRKSGDIAGWINSGHRDIGIFGHSYPAASIAYLLMTGAWPADRIDHRNNVGHDDRWKNLRPATQTQNCKNKRRRSNNTSGYVGVAKAPSGKRWRAYTGNKHIGCFDTAEEAAHAYDSAVRTLHGDFAYLNFPVQR
jgi:hypothetical protein